MSIAESFSDLWDFYLTGTDTVDAETNRSSQGEGVHGKRRREEKRRRDEEKKMKGDA